MKTVICLITALAFGLGSARAQLKVYISADMEGVGAAATRAQTSPQGHEYERFRRIMTGEVNAAIEGALEAGATEIVVSDSHGIGQNLLVEELNPKARLIRAWPRPLLMMEGIDESFDAAIFIGYHASEGRPGAVLAHTMSSARFYDLRLNGRSVPEAGFNAAVAGHFGVPVVMISGDQAIIRETRELLGDIEAAEVKRAIGYHASSSLHPAEARALIKDKAKRALQRLPSFRPYKISYPVRLELDLKSAVEAELLAMFPGVERLDGHTIAFTGKDMVEVSRFLCAAMFYNNLPN